MIGVISKPSEARIVGEFFQLFKTAWEHFEEGRAYDAVLTTTGEAPEADAKIILIYSSGSAACDARLQIVPGERLRDAQVERDGTLLPIYGHLLTFEARGGRILGVPGKRGVAGLRLGTSGPLICRFGYDLFEEAERLLQSGQPAENAAIPALEMHIAILREAICEAGIALVEIPPSPAGFKFMVCLTHDIDFVGIRNHKFDHTLAGFVYRATVGASRSFLKGRISGERLLGCWRAVLSLPLVHLGLVKDFWMPFDWYLEVEKNLPATYFLIPFKGRPGEKVATAHAERRASPYGVADIPEWTDALLKAGCEIGVHGIDSWHSVEKGREEFAEVQNATGERRIGIRMHWLLQDENTRRTLELAGYAYDSTGGYNETVGFRNGTTQGFRPLDVESLLELPMHIQDGALFYPDKLGLTEAEAGARCRAVIGEVEKHGGVLTLLWHDRSHGPERFWGEFYAKLVSELREEKVWFGSGLQVTEWFQLRRAVIFEREHAYGTGCVARAGTVPHVGLPPLALRVNLPRGEGESGGVRVVDSEWTGQEPTFLEGLVRKVSGARDGRATPATQAA